ncbi:transposase zinc-binding domain-containing protein (plasmid) [Escherichia coli]
MLPRFADIFQQGNRWLNWLEKQPEGSVRPVVIESVTKIMACGTTLMGYTQWCCSSPDCSHIKKVCFRCKSRSCPHCGSEGWRTVDTVSAESGSRLSVAAYCVHTSLPVLVPRCSTTGGYWQR